MKKYPALFLALILVFAFTAYVSFQIASKNYLKVLLAYQLGQKIALSPISEKTGCNVLPNYAIPFCHEGYSESFLRNVDGQPEFKLQEWEKKFKNPSQTELLGAGIAIAQFIFNSMDFENFLMQKSHMKESKQYFMMDGWAFSQLVYHGRDLKTSLAECTQLSSEKFKKICWFGVGRSFYFLSKTKDDFGKNDLQAMDDKAKSWFYKGLGFAGAFAGRNELSKESNKDVQKGMLIAINTHESYKKVDLNKPIHACLSRGEHFAFCN